MRPARGDRLGPFEIASLLGSGGMGEVYRARDTQLQRDVALKILPDGFALDGDRVARFKREAHVLASLNHPHIAAIYGFEESGDVQALVLELVEGPTLAERIARGPVPVAEALGLSKQLADALDAAHRQGIVHRDLKPANIKVRPDGALKVLDFGLAKALESPGAAANASQSPTFSAAATGAGVLLGTAGYMSPEQARGETVDHQADVWGFGCVLFEMLTGRRAFEGRTTSDAIAAVLRGDPDWSALPQGLHPRIRLLLERCLEKDTVNRYHSIADARVDIARALAEPDSAQVANGPAPAPGGARWPWALAAIVLAAVAALAAWMLKPEPVPRVERFAHVLPQGEQFTQTTHGLVAISRDGASIVYVANGSLYIRAIDQIEARPIAGTQGSPTSPFFSPDGRSVGYHDFRDGELRRVAVTGGTPVTLAEVTNLSGATWSPDDTIVFGKEDGAWRMPASGGTPERLVGLQPNERLHAPQLLPGGRSILFTLRATVGSAAWDNANVVVQSLDRDERRVITAGRDARYLPTGHLVYGLKSALMAMPFDLEGLQARGAAAPVVEGIREPTQFPGTAGTANYDVSDTGLLVYVAGTESAPIERELVAVDRRGTATPIVPEKRDYWRPRISPDGSRIVVEIVEAAGTELWIVDLKDSSASPLTSESPNTGFAAWSPDGQSVIYRSTSPSAFGIYRHALDGRGGPQLLHPSPEETMPGNVSADGTLVFAAGEQTGRRAILTLPIAGGEASPYLATPVLEHMPTFSPDGAWIAYASTESGRSEVYVRSYPSQGGTVRRISQNGGTAPVWSRDGTELFFRDASGTLVGVPVRLDAGVTPGRAQELFKVEGRFRTSGNAPVYDVDASGRFIMVTEPVQQREFARQITVVLNWHQELARLVPVR